MKKILFSIFLIIGIFVIYVQHKLIFGIENFDIKILDKQIGITKFKENYINYFLQKDKNPVYVWNNNIIQSYTDYCYKNKKNCIIMPHQQTYASYLWISTIQYIGDIRFADKAIYFYDILNNLTNISPYWDYTYAFGGLLIPIPKDMEGNSDKIKNTQRKQSWINTINLLEKGKYYNCEQQKINKISGLTEEQFAKIINGNSDDKNPYRNPCTHYDITSSLGFNYFYYLANGTESSKNYKISSFIDNAPTASALLAGTVLSKLGDYEKTLKLWFYQFISIQQKYDNSTNQNEKDFLFGQQEQYLNKSLSTYQFIVLQQADNLVINDSDCLHKYNCLEQKGFIKSILRQDMQKCQDIFKQNIDFEKLYSSKILQNLNEDQNLENIKCILLAYGISKNFIDPNGKLIHPFTNKDEKYIFRRDENRESRSFKIE